MNNSNIDEIYKINNFNKSQINIDKKCEEIIKYINNLSDNQIINIQNLLEIIIYLKSKYQKEILFHYL